MPGHVDEYEDLLTMNPIWRARTIGIGRLSPEDAKVLGASGPMIRGSGIACDLRKTAPYSGYENYEFEVATSDDCDCYGRYLVRVKEMREAVKILRQALDRLPDGPVNVDDRKMLPPAARGARDLDGGGHPPLQALHRGLLGSARATCTSLSSRVAARTAATSSATARTNRAG